MTMRMRMRVAWLRAVVLPMLGRRWALVRGELTPGRPAASDHSPLRMLMLMAPRRAWLAAATNHRRWLDRLPPLTLTVTATAAATVAASSMQRSQPSIEILTSIVAVGVAVAERLHK
jgi:hypothetical protein